MDNVLFSRLVQLGKDLADEFLGFNGIFLSKQFLELLYGFFELKLSFNITGMSSFVYAITF